MSSLSMEAVESMTALGRLPLTTKVGEMMTPGKGAPIGSLYGKSAEGSREPYMLARAGKCSRERALLA
jgi:hypothetical protein